MDQTTDNKTVLVAIAHGFEEIETITVVDILRRAGAIVTLASIVKDTRELTGSNKIVVKTDELFQNVVNINFDMIVIPGGVQNAQSLRDCKELIEKLKKQQSENKIIGSICASPADVLQQNGLLDDVEDATCANSYLEFLKGKQKTDERVVVCGKVITSKSPGTTMEFAFALVQVLFGEENQNSLSQQILAKI